MNLKTWTSLKWGRAAELARALGVSQPLMSRWIGGEEIPENRARQIERATGGAVTMEEMLPDKAAEFEYMRNRPVVEAAALAAIEATDPILKAA